MPTTVKLDYFRVADNQPGTRVNESTALFLSI